MDEVCTVYIPHSQKKNNRFNNRLIAQFVYKWSQPIIVVLRTAPPPPLPHDQALKQWQTVHIITCHFLPPNSSGREKSNSSTRFSEMMRL